MRPSHQIKANKRLDYFSLCRVIFYFDLFNQYIDLSDNFINDFSVSEQNEDI